MRKLLLLVVPGALCSFTVASVHAQRYGRWEVPCDSRLPPRFSAPFYSGVIFESKEFLTEWSSIHSPPPHPSFNWYEAIPDRDPISRDGNYYWYGAGVQVHCEVERNPYWIQNLRTPVAYRGALRSRRTACDGDTPVTNVGYEEYEPYEPFSPGDEDCTSTGGGSGGGSGIQFQPGDYTDGETVDWHTGVGNGGVSVCGQAARVEYICIDQYDESVGMWYPWGCGYATTC